MIFGQRLNNCLKCNFIFLKIPNKKNGVDGRDPFYQNIKQHNKIAQNFMKSLKHTTEMSKSLKHTTVMSSLIRK